MPQVQSNAISIEYQLSGPEDGAPLLLIHGVGAPMTRWPEAWCTALGDAGFRVIRFDNRDVGLSTHLTGVPVPDLAALTAAQKRGEDFPLPYTLSDMAADTVGLLDALGIESVHVLGVSLGGMISQVLAIEYPDRVRSLNIMMSQSGNPELPPSDPALIALLAEAAPDPAINLEGYLRHSVALNRALGSPDYPTDEQELRGYATVAASRSYDPPGTGRQLVAGRGAPDRRAALARLRLPTLVIHGAEDRLILPVCGEDIARHVKGACMMVVNGMGHDIPAPLFGLFVAAIKANSVRSLG